MHSILNLVFNKYTNSIISGFDLQHNKHVTCCKHDIKHLTKSAINAKATMHMRQCDYNPQEQIPIKTWRAQSMPMQAK